MTLTPLPGHIIITPYLHSDAMAKSVHERSGLYIPKPDNKHSFEGVPSRGFIVALPENYDGELKVGQQVIFSENQPKGFKDPDDDKRTLFALKLEQIVATLEGSDD